jgi:hypothetical protein
MPASPSLLIVPARFKTGKLYTQIATTSAGLVLGSSGDFNVTRATTATRFNSAGLIESVASGVPRLDYYTSGGTAGCPALLVEPSAANGILDSADTATNWLLGANLTSGYVDVIGVSGNNLTVAASGSGIGAAAGALRRISNNVALASGSTYTISFLMKKTGAHTIGGYYAALTGGAAGDLGAGFNVSGSFSSGQIYNPPSGTTNRIRRVEQWGTDVYRCSETFTMTASGTLTQFFIGPTVSTTANTNPAVGAQLAFAAPQIELGSVPTTFIPTTAAAVTRNADEISRSSISGCIGQTEGTIYAELDLSRAFASVVIILGNGSSEGFRIRRNSNFSVFVQAVNTSGSATLFTSSAASAGIYKIAFGYKNGDYAMSINGAAVQTSSNSANFPVNALDRLLLGETIGGVPYFNDRMRAVALYTTRLTNAELQTLTTL